MDPTLRRHCRVSSIAVICLLFMAGCSTTEPSENRFAVAETTADIAVAGTTPTSEPLQTPSPRPTSTPDKPTPTPTSEPVITGLGQLAATGFAPLVNKRVGVIANATSVHGDEHIIDLLAAADAVELVAAFAPEHGIRGAVDAGVEVDDTVDDATGIPLFSLYGDVRAPTAASLDGIDAIVYDLQDVGARYYTYISTLGLAMQAAAAADVSFFVLDRPNPLGGDLVAGFVRQPDLESFVSLYPVPSVYAMTAGELANAIVGERWLPGLDDLDLTVVPLTNWQRSMRWDDTGLVWRAPSPGLPTSASALVYPATVPFEATTLSYGKGTTVPFQVIGAPWVDADALADNLNARDLAGIDFAPARFTPSSAIAPNPRHVNIELSGVALEVTDPAVFDPVSAGLHLLSAVQAQATARGQGTVVDRPAMFDLLAGSTQLRTSLMAATPAETISEAWAAETAEFTALRDRYLLY